MSNQRLNDEEFEERLYAQLHHKLAPQNREDLGVNLPFVPRPTRIVSSTSVENRSEGVKNNPGAGRYWRMPNSAPHSFRMPTPVPQGRAYRPSNPNFTPPAPNINVPSAIRPRVFNSYSPVMNFMRPEDCSTMLRSPVPSNLVRPSASNQNNDNNFRNNRAPPYRNTENRGRNKPQPPQFSRIENAARSKVAKMGKYQEKKQRGIQSRSRGAIRTTQTSRQGIRQPIIVESSEEENDDVIEIPMTPPPMVCLDDSDSESEASAAHEFQPPLSSPSTTKVPDQQFIAENNSRPVSPTSSVVSDDFIAHNDRERLKVNDRSIIAEDELQCDMITVDQAVTRLNRSTPDNITMDQSEPNPQVEMVDGGDNVTSPLKVSSRKITEDSSKSYTVTNPSIRQTDVYESESSDIPDSIYQRETRTNEVPARHFGDDSDSGDQNILNADRIKKLRKRKSSGSHKSSENASETDDDDGKIVNDILIKEMLEERKRNRLPNIRKGSAIENRAVGKRKPQSKRKKLSDKSNDADFISILSNLVHGGDGTPIIEEDYEVYETDGDEDSENNDDGKEKEPEPFDIAGNSNGKLVVIDTVGEPDELVIDGVVLDKECKESTEDVIGEKSPLVDENDFEPGWNNEMKQFYNESWNGENFDVNKILESMEGNESDWAIRPEDEFSVLIDNRDARLKCRNCNEFGHRQSKCRSARKPILCSMCGKIGHREYRCPNKICLRCGEPSQVFLDQCFKCKRECRQQCPLCKVIGHSKRLCPDLWRRYHSTTKDNVPLVPAFGYNKIKQCSICVRRGHLAESCHSHLRTMNKNIATSRIISYKPAYSLQQKFEQQPLENQKSGVILTSVGPNSMFDFDSSVLRDTRSFYGRFLQSVRDRKEALRPKKKNYSTTASNIDTTVIDDDEETVPKPDNPAKHKLLINPFAKIISKSCGKASEKLPDDKGDDSNYSFSEFYNPSDAEKADGRPQTAVESRLNVSFGGDFIPLSDVDETKTISTDENVSRRIDSDEKEEEEECKAKIYLTKDDSQLLMSPNGNKLLSDLVGKYKVSAKMEWYQHGSFLVLIGTPLEQDKFHKNLTEELKIFQKLNKQHKLEQSLQVPKNRAPLIKYITEQLELLKANMGDVNRLYRQMKFNQKLDSKNGQKMVDKARRTLNIILLGQSELRDGKIHTVALKDILIKLNANPTITISTQLRDEIFQHVKYIFSPFEHSDYETLIEEYHTKRIRDSEQNKIVEITEDSDVQEQPPMTDAELREPSVKWSEKCREIVLYCHQILNCEESSSTYVKLTKVLEKANENCLNYLDYGALLKVRASLEASNT